MFSTICASIGILLLRFFSVFFWQRGHQCHVRVQGLLIFVFWVWRFLKETNKNACFLVCSLYYNALLFIQLNILVNSIIVLAKDLKLLWFRHPFSAAIMALKAKMTVFGTFPFFIKLACFIKGTDFVSIHVGCAL